MKLLPPYVTILLAFKVIKSAGMSLFPAMKNNPYYRTTYGINTMRDSSLQNTQQTSETR